jgi:hypothetical protein
VGRVKSALNHIMTLAARVGAFSVIPGPVMWFLFLVIVSPVHTQDVPRPPPFPSLPVSKFDWPSGMREEIITFARKDPVSAKGKKHVETTNVRLGRV